MRLQNPFSAINSSNLEAQVLYVLTRAEARFSAQEIHRLLPEGGSNQGTRNALQRLVQHGIVLSEPIGSQTVYIFNRQHRSEEHTSELQSRFDLVCRLLLEKKNSYC